MLSEIQAVRTYFSKLGFEPEIADIYLALHAEGPQTIAALARSSKVERTKIYRLIDRLLESNLIEVETRYKRGIVKAAPIANLHILIAQKEQDLKALQDELGLIEQVLARNSLSDPTTRVQFYRGPEGVRQMQWNQTRAKRKELLSIIDDPIQQPLGKQFTIRWADAIKAADISLRMVVSPRFKEQNKAWYKSQDMAELVEAVHSRVIEPSVFPISANIDIWDNVVSFYSLRDGELYGIEVHNAGVAAVQRQLFEMLWAVAKDVPRTVEK